MTNVAISAKTSKKFTGKGATRKRKLTKQEKKFVEIKAETGNGTLAVQKAFEIEDPNYAGVKAHRLLSDDKIISALEEALPDELLAKVHREGLEATKRSGVGGMKIGIGTDGKVNDFGHTEIDEPDYAVRHKYLDSAYKLKGSYAAEKHINVSLQISKEERDKILGISAEVRKRMTHAEING